LSLKLNVAEWLESRKMQWVKLVIMTKATTHQRGARALDFNIIIDAKVIEKGWAALTLILTSSLSS